MALSVMIFPYSVLLSPFSSYLLTFAIFTSLFSRRTLFLLLTHSYLCLTFLSLPHAFLMIVLSLTFPTYIYKDPLVEYSSVVLTLTSLRNNTIVFTHTALVTLS